MGIASFFKSIYWFIISKLISLPRYRLASAISVYRSELGAREALTNLSQGGRDAVKKALELLDNAEDALRKFDVDKGWKCFHGARRMELFSLDIDHEIPAVLTIMREEAEKLPPWRKKAVFKLIGTPDSPKDVKDIYTVISAALIRDVHYGNSAYKSTLTMWFNMGLVVLLVASLIGIYELLDRKIILFGDMFKADTLYAYISIAMFGFFGAVVSAITKQINMTGKSSTIPEVLTAWRITGLRIIGGAAFAVVVYIFLQTQMVNDIFIAAAIKAPTPYTIYGISIAAGFSERLVLKSVEAVEGKKG